jgi:hypothetical protein
MVGESGPSTALSACRGDLPDLLHERSKRPVARAVLTEEIAGKLGVRHREKPGEYPARGGVCGDRDPSHVTLKQHVKLLHAAPAAPQEASALDAGSFARRHE